jgi:hypothetical protein
MLKKVFLCLFSPTPLVTVARDDFGVSKEDKSFEVKELWKI